MKNILIVVFAVLVCCTQKNIKSGKIFFEKLGESDKPFTTIVISTYNLTGGTFKKVIIVDEESFNSIYKFIDSQEKRYHGKWRIDEEGAFQVSTLGDGLISSYVIPSREKSIKYFNELKEHLKKLEGRSGISEIQKELDILLKRIGA